MTPTQIVAGSAALLAIATCSPAHAAEPAPESSRLSVSGYVQIYYKARVEQSGDGLVEPDAFRFGRVKIQFSGKLKHRLSYVVEVDPRSPQVAGIMRDCYLQWGLGAHQDLRVGQMKTPFGWENRTSTADLYTVSRTEVGELFGRGLTLRDIGLGWFGRVPLGNGFRLENELTLTNGAGLGAQADDDHRKNVFGRLGGRMKLHPGTLSLGLSGAAGTIHEPVDPAAPDQPPLSFDFKRFGADLEYENHHVFAVTEYAHGDEEASLPEEGGSLSAWYVLAAGKTRWDVGPVVRYAEFDIDTHGWTLGGYYGSPGAVFRSIVTYEISTQAGERHDDRLIVWSQVRF